MIPRDPKRGQPILAQDIAWLMKRARRAVRGGPGIRVKDTPAGITIEAVGGKGGGGGRASECQNWNLSVQLDNDDKLQLLISNPSTIGGEMPEFDGVPLDDLPNPLIEIPDGSAEYLIYVRFEWEPGATELGPGDWVINADGGTLIPPIEIIVAPIGTPPTDETPTIDGTDGSVTQNGIQHRRWAKVERQSGGELLIRQNEFCGAMEYAICAGRVRLGRV